MQMLDWKIGLLICIGGFLAAFVLQWLFGGNSRR